MLITTLSRFTVDTVYLSPSSTYNKIGTFQMCMWMNRMYAVKRKKDSYASGFTSKYTQRR